MPPIEFKDFPSLREKVKKSKILVMGDFILDEYLYGKVERISPEAPVPVVWVQSEKLTLGGAGNVVKNLSSLGVQSFVLGRSGKDSNSELLHSLLEQENVKTENMHFLKNPNLPTILKTRIMGGHQQVCRVDREKILPLDDIEINEIKSKIKQMIPLVDGIILSDYQKGFFNDEIIQIAIEESVKHSKIITVDPQVKQFWKYLNVSNLTPNHHEAGSALGRTLNDNQSIESALFEISKRLNSKAVMITRGDKGMSIWNREDGKIHHIPTDAREVFDVTGAGDTVISLYTAFQTAGLSVYDSSYISNVGAGIVVAKQGSATVSWEELESSLRSKGDIR
jgi:rfaE bifunctional protein kinase chain/domain